MLRKIISICCLMLALTGVSFAVAHTVELDWLAPVPTPSPALSTYNIYKGTSGHETFLAAISSSLITYTDTAVIPGQSYCYRVTDVNVNGLESIQGNEICATIPNVDQSVTTLDFGRRLVNTGESATQAVVFTNNSGASVIVEDDATIGFLPGIRISGTTASLVLTAAVNASGGNTVYTGTITGGGSNAYAGVQFIVGGFTTTANNSGSPGFICVASTSTTLTLVNASGAAETHAATASGSINFVQSNALGTLPQTITNTSTFTVNVAFNPLLATSLTSTLIVHLHDGTNLRVPLTGIGSQPTPTVQTLQTDDVSLPFPDPLQKLNAQWVNGVAPGFFPQACGGLVLCVGKGLYQDGSSGSWVIRNVPAVTPTLGTSVTTHIYLDHTDNFNIHTSTSAVACDDYWVGDAVTDGTHITAVSDFRSLGFRVKCP